jgi:glycogen(starch) synthase
MADDIFEFEEDRTPLSSSLTLTGGNSISMMSSVPSAKPLLFDVSWEVCRKVGGIYTVMTSKARITVNEWGDRYGLIGPYSDVAYREFEEMPPSKQTAKLMEIMKSKYGIKVYFGRWLVKGYPKVFLIDIASSANMLDHWRNELMGSFVAPNDPETNDAIVFGNQVCLFFQEFVKIFDRPVVAHFHEWLTGVGLIRVKQNNIQLATIFTTHATLLGRYMAAGRVDLYNVIHKTNADEEAGRRGIYHRHWIEAGAARGADVFTTVSEITGYEAEHALGVKPHFITPNGLIVDKFVALHEFQNLHRKNKDKISEFVRGHFFGHLDFDIDKTLYLFTAGRREYYNKGVDIFIESLAQLNYMLKQAKSDVTVIAFLIIPGPANHCNIESIKGQSLRRDVSDTCTQISKHVRERLYESLIRGEIPDANKILSQEDMVAMKRRVQALQSNSSLPPIVTHNMNPGAEDEILDHLRRCNLLNKSEDRVKIIYHPEFLNLNSPIFPIDYNDFVRGCHMGVFPSYYEPWGYTPAECLVMGVPSITSNLTGFANYISTYVPEPEENGIYIVDRRHKSFGETKDQMANMMFNFSQLSRRQRIELRNKTEALSYLLDWKLLGKFYFKARRQALQQVFGIEIPMPAIFAQPDENGLEDAEETGTAF